MPKVAQAHDRMIGVVVYLVLFYLVIGMIVSLPFAFMWSERIDPAVQSSTLGFKLLIIPGCALLWPYLLMKVQRS